MPRFFIPAQAKAGKRFIIEGAVANHLAGSLRARTGDTVVFCVEGEKEEYGAKLESVSTSQVTAEQIWCRPARGEAEMRVVLLQALSKDGMDEAVDAAVAAGVTAIWPVITERTVVRLNGERAPRRQQHWQNIAREAAQIAWRSQIPEVMPVMELDAALSQIHTGTLVACDIDDDAQPLARMKLRGLDVALVIGPEGGLSDADRRLLQRYHCQFAHLGPRVWRSRNAAAAAVTVIMATHDQLNETVAAT